MCLVHLSLQYEATHRMRELERFFRNRNRLESNLWRAEAEEELPASNLQCRIG
jgi:hypothetical protein